MGQHSLHLSLGPETVVIPSGLMEVQPGLRIRSAVRARTRSGRVVGHPEVIGLSGGAALLL